MHRPGSSTRRGLRRLPSLRLFRRIVSCSFEQPAMRMAFLTATTWMFAIVVAALAQAAAQGDAVEGDEAAIAAQSDGLTAGSTGAKSAGSGTSEEENLSDRTPWIEQHPVVMKSVAIGQSPAENDRDTFRLQPGFRVERLFEVPQDTHGSWVSLAFDDAGRLLACDQDAMGLSRITVPPIGSDEPTRVEKLTSQVTGAQGLLYAFDSLYASINGEMGSGLYRVRDTNGDGDFDEVKKLKDLRGRGEHGPHTVRLSPDGTSLYVVCGNHTDPPAPLAGSRLLPNWGEDLLLPRQWDARGHAKGRLAPGGWIAKTDPDGERWELISSGYRNTFDFDFNADGELFAYDADMEWDFGMPWYRPTRVVHAVSGSDFGWRSGTGKWPDYYVDSLPSIVDIGPGSPTGVTFGTGTRFPSRYQRALFLLDWTFGTMYALHLHADGATYAGEKEEFVARAALPLTDAVVGPDGALYFAVGGRRTQSALYRVTYVGDQTTSAASGHDETDTDRRELRRQLEAFHPRMGAPARDVDLELIWQCLADSDRFIRYAARVGLEWQPLARWQDRGLSDPDVTRRIEAAVALARSGSAQLTDANSRARLRAHTLRSLNDLNYADLTLSQRRDLLRAYALVFIRLGRPSLAEAASVVQRLDPHFPAEVDSENRELSRVLVYLNAPAVVQKTLTLMEQDYELPTAATDELLSRNPGYGRTIAAMLANHPEQQKLHYAFVLRNMRYGWTLDERKQYFDWLSRAKQRSGGESYNGFIDNIRTEALANLSESERESLANDVIAPPPDRRRIAPTAGAGPVLECQRRGGVGRSRPGRARFQGRSTRLRRRTVCRLPSIRRLGWRHGSGPDQRRGPL